MLTLASAINSLQQHCIAQARSDTKARYMESLDQNDNKKYKCPSETKIEMCQVIQSIHVDKRGYLSSGQLLKWVDITACLAAEKLAGYPCVTVSVDDLYLEDQVQLGDVICIQSQVNRAFNTSMEVGVKVTSETIEKCKQMICEAFLTFVSISEAGRKVKLPPFLCETAAEEHCYSLAEERRRVRISHSKTIHNLLLDYETPLENVGNDGDINIVSGSDTRVESVELVLPPHANHHGNTFGGQIMSWVENVGSISAGRFSASIMKLQSVDMVHFRGPSYVGDRIVLHAVVNCAFKNSLEVGVRVEAYNCEKGKIGERRHINSAFLTYVSDKKLPVLDPDHGKDGIRRFREATARGKLRLDRRYILSSKRKDKLSVALTKDNGLYISYDNIKTLSQLASKTDWKTVSSESILTLSTREEEGILMFKVSRKLQNMKVSDFHAFKVLSDPRNRMHWDPLMVNCELIRGRFGTAEDCVYHTTMKKGLNEEVSCNDFILLYSCRKPSRSGDPYVVAIRSVILDDMPDSQMENYNITEVACAGFVIQQLPGECTEVSYYNETNPKLVGYVTCDVAGLSKTYSVIYNMMEKYIVDQLSDEYFLTIDGKY